MLLNIYLVTTAINWVVTITCSVACKKNLKRKGYKFVKQEESMLEKVVTFISIAFKLSIPVLNILNTIWILSMGDKIYEYIEDKLLEDGKIDMPTGGVKIEAEINEDKISPIEESKTYTEEEKKVSLEKKPEEIPENRIKEINEKIASLNREKEILIGFKQEKQGPVFKKQWNKRQK